MRSFLRASAVILLAQILLLATWAWLDARETEETSIGSADALLGAYERFRAAQVAGDALTIPLGQVRGLARVPGGAQGELSLGLQRGEVRVRVTGLEAARLQHVWLVDERAGGRTAEIDLGPLLAGDGESTLEASLELQATAGFEIDRVVVGQPEGPGHGAIALAGSPSLFQRLYYQEQRGGGSPSAGSARGSAPQRALPFLLLVPVPASAEAGTMSLAGLVLEGERLFFEETFGGNGRTCGTCHPAGNNFTIDADFIATLPDDDPLFVAEFEPALALLEDPQLMREFGLILANVDGFDDPAGKFVMRSVSHLLGGSMTIQNGAPEAPFDSTGWGGDGAPGGGRLRDFPTGAVTQHFTKTLDRNAGIDFRLPTQDELDALEAFMLSIGRQAEFDLLGLRLSDPVAEEGRRLFTTEDSENQTVKAAKCSLCHMNGGSLTVEGVNRSFDTGVEHMPHPTELAGGALPADGGFGTQLDPVSGGFGNGDFNVPSLWEAADSAPFFHHNAAATLEDAISFYDSPEFKDSPEGIFIQAFDSGGQELSVEIDELAAFLRVMNTIENVRSATDYLGRARTATTRRGKTKLMQLAQADLEDGAAVLDQSELHPETISGLDAARATIAAAIAAANAPVGCSGRSFDTTNSLIGDALLEAVVARDHMLETPLAQLPEPIPVPQPASSDPEPPPPPPTPDPAPGEPVCTIYGCSATAAPPPPDPGTAPDPSPTPSHSAEGEAIGTVAAVNLDAFTITVSTSAGLVTLQVTSATVFKGTVASHLGQVVVGHDVDTAFFIATNQVETLETNFPDVF